MTAVIEVEHLRKEYRRRGARRSVAVDGLDLSVPEGGVFGFLGPNGSGKTTTIRCLLGLVEPTSGRTALFGESGRRALPRVMSRIGAIVETPALFPTMSGHVNLRLLGAFGGIGPRRVDECLELVGLAERADDLVRKYSLGMRQRLGLAAALLKDPALLILDEPVNGLDPAGIRETRELMLRLGREGRTVFVSSHLLSEIEQTCDRVAIIDRGRLVLDGRVADVLRQAARQSMLVGIAEPGRAQAVLCRAGLNAEIEGGHVRVMAGVDEGTHINRVLADAGLYLDELRAESVSLEDLFLRITAHEEVAA